MRLHVHMYPPPHPTTPLPHPLTSSPLFIGWDTRTRHRKDLLSPVIVSGWVTRGAAGKTLAINAALANTRHTDRCTYVCPVRMCFNFRRFNVCGFCKSTFIRKGFAHKNLDTNRYVCMVQWPTTEKVCIMQNPEK